MFPVAINTTFDITGEQPQRCIPAVPSASSDRGENSLFSPKRGPPEISGLPLARSPRTLEALSRSCWIGQGSVVEGVRGAELDLSRGLALPLDSVASSPVVQLPRPFSSAGGAHVSRLALGFLYGKLVSEGLALPVSHEASSRHKDAASHAFLLLSRFVACVPAARPFARSLNINVLRSFFPAAFRVHPAVVP